MASPSSSQGSGRDLAEATEQLALSDTAGGGVLPADPLHPPGPTHPPQGESHAPETPPPGDGHAHHLHEDEEEEDPLSRSVGMEDEVGQLLRTTVEELESALQESRRLLAERDEELERLRSELDRYKKQAAREIANKTKLAQALDESHAHAHELEELLQQWQVEVRETKLQGERATAYLHREQSRAAELERKLRDKREQDDKEIEQLRTQLIEARQNLSRHHGSTIASDSNPGPSGIDEMQLHFLKQAVYHLLTDFHADDQLRAIVSILDFSAQERKAVYARVQDRKGGVRGPRRGRHEGTSYD